MQIQESAQILSREDCRLIHGGVVRILGQVGVRVDHERLCERLADAGASVDSNGVARLGEKVIDELVANSQVEQRPAGLRFNAGGYPPSYLDPETGEVRAHTMDSCRRYIQLADQLDQIDTMNCVGYPGDVPAKAMRLYEKFLSFLAHKPYHSAEVTSVAELGPYAELCAAREELTGRPTPVAGKIYLTHPFYIDRQRAELFLAFHDRGFRAVMPTIPTGGLTCPITIAGLLAHAIASQMFHGFLQGAFHGSGRFSLGNFGGFIDLRTTLIMKGRPECALVIMGMHAMARHYGVACVSGGQFQSQAKTLGSVQSGVERLMEALPGLLAGGTHFGSLGGISQPEHITSPVQLVIDDEVAAMLRRFARGFEVDAESLGVEALQEMGHEGLFVSHPHTARHCREALLMPRLFTGGVAYGPWRSGGAETEFDRAQKRYRDIMAQPYQPALDPDQQEKLMAIIRKAEHVL